MATNCQSLGLYESLNYCPGETVLPGIRNQVYCISKRDIVTYPTLPEFGADVAMNTTSVYVGNFVFAAEKKAQRIDMVLNKGQVEWEVQGEDPAITFLNKATLSHPKTDEAAAAFQRLAAHDDLIYFVQVRSGKWRVLGNEMFNTVTKPKGSTGEGTTGESGSQFEIEATDVCPAPFYVGTLDTVDGEIACGSGDEADSTGIVIQ